MRRFILAAFALTVLAACQPATTEFTDTERTAIRSEVTQEANSLVDAFRQLDADTYASFHSTSLVWAENGAITTNRDSLTNVWRDMYATSTEAGADWEETHVRVLGPDAAVFTGSFTSHTVDSEGTRTDFQGVWTAVFARTAEGWEIVHGHESYTIPESM